jgi:hypothetical protein
MTGTTTMVKGVEFSIAWIFKLDALTPKPLDDYNVLVQIRPSKQSSAIIATYDLNSPYLSFTPSEGRVELFLPPTVTTTFSFCKAVIDCWVYNNDSEDGDRSPTYEIIYDVGVSRL